MKGTWSSHVKPMSVEVICDCAIPSVAGSCGVNMAPREAGGFQIGTVQHPHPLGRSNSIQE